MIKKETEIAVRNFALGYVAAAVTHPIFTISMVEAMITAMEEQFDIERSTAVWYGNQALILAGREDLKVSFSTPGEPLIKPEAKDLEVHFLLPKDD